MTLKIKEYDSVSNEAVIELTTLMYSDSETESYHYLNNLTPDMGATSVSIIAFADNNVLPLDNKNTSVRAFLTTNIVLENQLRIPQKTKEGYFSYHLFAKVRDLSRKCVCIGEIDILLDTPLPKDIENDSYISFDVVRLDLVRTGDGGVS